MLRCHSSARRPRYHCCPPGIKRAVLLLVAGSGHWTTTPATQIKIYDEDRAGSWSCSLHTKSPFEEERPPLEAPT